MADRLLRVGDRDRDDRRPPWNRPGSALVVERRGTTARSQSDSGQSHHCSVCTLRQA